MAIRIEETFHVRAPIDRVWRYLVDPRQVVTCLPGAELTGEESANTFTGRVKVKVGPVTAAYSGRATIAERDDDAHTLVLSAEGREATGSGSARTSMRMRVTQHDAACEVRVEADVDVVGKIAQFGRGMIETVGRQLFKQFTECVRAQLEREEPTPTAEAPVVDVPNAPAPPPPPPPPQQPLRMMPLLLRALREWLRRLLPRKAAS